MKSYDLKSTFKIVYSVNKQSRCVNNRIASCTKYFTQVRSDDQVTLSSIFDDIVVRKISNLQAEQKGREILFDEKKINDQNFVMNDTNCCAKLDFDD